MSQPATPEGGSGQRRGQFVLLSGMSGAGRTTAADVLEDRGWYVVDNLPPQMLVSLVDMIEGDDQHARIAAVIDARSRDFGPEVDHAIRHLREHGWQPRVIFIDATDEVLVRRFESVRRPHPLQGEGLLLEGIEAERRMVGDLKAEADVIVDTSSLNVHQLSAKIDDLLSTGARTRLRIAVMSFGFKYGIPLDADIVLDMRFVPNPFWDPELRAFTGRDAPVRDFVLSQPGVDGFIHHTVELLHTMTDGYLAEGRRHVTVAIGCTGGKHRSVATVEEVVRRLDPPAEVQVTSFHRDLGRE